MAGCKRQEKTFEREYTFHGSRVDSRQTSHAISATQMRTTLLSDVVAFLYPELRSDSSQYAQKVEALAAGILSMEMLEEKWDSAAKQLRIRAAMMVDSDYVKNRIVENMYDEQKTADMVESRRKAKTAHARTMKLREEIIKNPTPQAEQEYMAETKKLEAEEYFVQAMNAQENGSYAPAVESLQKAVAIDSNDAAAYNNMGLAYIEMKDYANAVISFKKAIGIDSSNIYALNNLGNAYIAQRLLGDAIACYKRVVAIEPSYIYAWNNLGNAYDEQNMADDAIACYQKCIGIDSAFAGAYGNMGVVYTRQQKHTQAIQCYRKALEIDPNFAEAYNNIGYAYYVLQQYDLAISNIQKAINTAPNIMDAHRNMAMVYGAKGNAAKQTHYYKQAAKLGDSTAQAWLRSKGQRW
jgi:tetratricopeptide (TPR) repeat protein